MLRRSCLNTKLTTFIKVVNFEHFNGLWTENTHYLFPLSPAGWYFDISSIYHTDFPSKLVSWNILMNKYVLLRYKESSLQSNVDNLKICFALNMLSTYIHVPFVDNCIWYDYEVDTTRMWSPVCAGKCLCIQDA